MTAMNVDLDPLAEGRSVRFLYHKVTLFSFFILFSLEGSHYAQPTFKEQGVMHHLKFLYILSGSQMKINGPGWCAQWIE